MDLEHNNSKVKEVANTVAKYFETKVKIKSRQKGRQEEKLEMAHRMKSKEMTISEIAEITELSEEDVRIL